jgi:GNAT superfamily N-acetyltransferase
MLLQETENRLSEGEFTLVDVVDQDDWKAYHHIRRTVLFDARGVSGYDANHPDEHSPTNHPLLLKHDGRDAVGTVRLDQRSAGGGIIRLVAIRSDYQRRGIGRLMMVHVETRCLCQRTTGSSFFCVHISETKIFVHTMRRRALCGAEGRIRHDRTWTA